MSVLRREFHRSKETGREECWDLVFDTASKRLYVEHKSTSAQPGGAGWVRREQMDICTYFATASASAAASGLWRLLMKLFDEER